MEAKAGDGTNPEALAIGPAPARDGRVPVLIGGTSDKAIARAVTWAAGWTAGGGTAEQTRPIRDTVAQFEDAGVTELYFDPTVATLDQVDRLADLVL